MIAAILATLPPPAPPPAQTFIFSWASYTPPVTPVTEFKYNDTNNKILRKGN